MGEGKLYEILFIFISFLYSCSGVVEVESIEDITITDSTSTTETKSTFVEEKKQSYKDCQKTTVMIPADVQSEQIVISCSLITENVSYATGFEYNIFASDLANLPCGKNNHKAFWFLSKNSENISISEEKFLHSKNVIVNDIDWINNQVDSLVGSIGIAKISFEEEFQLEKNNLFCFGYSLSKINEKFTCPIVCETNTELYRHQISLNTEFPYNFISLSDFGYDYAIISLFDMKQFY